MVKLCAQQQTSRETPQKDENAFVSRYLQGDIDVFVDGESAIEDGYVIVHD